MTARLRVKNWAEFQHYKDRAPPWIKLHRTLLDDFRFARLPIASRALAPMIWLLASEDKDGCVVADIEELAFRLRWDVSDVAAGIKPLIAHGFLIDDSGALADCKRIARPETEGEGEGEEEGEAKPPVGAPPAAPADRYADDVRTVFAHWQQVHGHPTAKLGDTKSKRYKAIAGRLRDGYSVEQLKAAVDGCKRSPHHMGENERATVYDDIELICRDAAHVDKFIRLSGTPALAGLTATGRRAAAATQQWLDGGADAAH